MKRRKESRSTNVHPSIHLSASDLSPHPPPLADVFALLPGFLLMGSLFGFDIQDVKVEECNARPHGRNCSLSFLGYFSKAPFELEQKQVNV